MDKQSLIHALGAWDGKQTDDLQRIGETLFVQASDFTLLLNLLQHNPELQVAVTWLLKYRLAKGYKLNAADSDRLIVFGVQLEKWQSILHFLQSLKWVSISELNRVSLEMALRRWIVHENKFLRAWCYDAWHILAKEYPQYRDEVILFFEMAQRDEAASVKARIRQIQKHGMWASK